MPLQSSSETIEALIERAAIQNSPETNQLLYASLRSAELFYATKISEDEHRRRLIPLLQLPDGKHAMMFYTSKDDPNLPDTFGGATWQQALEIVLKMPQADSLILSNATAQSVAIAKSSIPEILQNMALAPPASPRQEIDPLQALITEAAATPSEALSKQILAGLQGRELYFEMAKTPDETIAPVMPTYRIGETPGILRLFFSNKPRTRACPAPPSNGAPS